MRKDRDRETVTRCTSQKKAGLQEMRTETQSHRPDRFDTARSEPTLVGEFVVVITQNERSHQDAPQFLAQHRRVGAARMGTLAQFEIVPTLQVDVLFYGR